MSIIRNIDVQANYIHTITEADLDGRDVPLAFMVVMNVNQLREFDELSGTPKQLNEWFGLPEDREHSLYLMVGAFSRPHRVAGNTDWSNHGAPAKAVTTKVSQGDFRPELFPSYLPAIWLEGLVEGDILVINKALAFKISHFNI